MALDSNTINGVIYKTTNIINGMWYIGKDEKDNPNYLGSGVYLSKAIAKYGRSNFVKEILDRSTKPSELALLECKYIEEYNATSDTMSYNIATGGYGGNTLAGMNDADKLQFSRKMSETWNNLTIESRTDRLGPMHNSVKHKPKTQAHKDKISKSKSGIKQSAETIEKKRLISKKLYDAGVICPPKNNWSGKTHSDESKLKMSKSKTGIKNQKRRLFTVEEQMKIQYLYNNNVSASEIAKIFNTSRHTILRYAKEII